MLQISVLRENKEKAIELLKKRNKDFTHEVTSAILLDDKRKALQQELDQILTESNSISKEIGELFKAVRKASKLKMDVNSNTGSIEEELADILIYICSIANRFGIDLEQAFRDKEEINKKSRKGRKRGQSPKI